MEGAWGCPPVVAPHAVGEAHTGIIITGTRPFLSLELARSLVTMAPASAMSERADIGLSVGLWSGTGLEFLRPVELGLDHVIEAGRIGLESFGLTVPGDKVVHPEVPGNVARAESTSRREKRG